MQILQPHELTEDENKLLANYLGGASHPCRTPDGSLCCMWNMAGYTKALLIDLTFSGHENRFCYKTMAQGVAALIRWDGTDGTEPDGWHRHPTSGRRRDEQGVETIRA